MTKIRLDLGAHNITAMTTTQAADSMATTTATTTTMAMDLVEPEMVTFVQWLQPVAKIQLA